MAADASVKRTDEILVFSSFLQSFCDSMVKNGTSFSNLMAQKLEQLKRVQKQAINLVEVLKKQERLAEKAIAARPMRDDYPMLLTAYHDQHRKVLDAEMQLGKINEQVHVAQFAVLRIINETRSFQIETKKIIDDGRSFLEKAHDQLKLYQEQK